MFLKVAETKIPSQASGNGRPLTEDVDLINAMDLFKNTSYKPQTRTLTVKVQTSVGNYFWNLTPGELITNPF